VGCMPETVIHAIPNATPSLRNAGPTSPTDPRRDRKVP
jgi:hypothetical protein